MHPPPTTTRFALSPAVRDLLESNRERGHTHIMSAFRSGLGDSPRAAAQIQWRLDGKSSELTVRAMEAAERPEILGAPLSTLPSPSPRRGEEIVVRAALSCQKTPRSDVPVELRPLLKQGRAYRSRMIVVPENERESWALSRLSRLGLTVDRDSLHIGGLQYASLGQRRRGIPYVELRATAEVSDEAPLADALRKGIGRGKNYGLGLLLACSATATT